MSEAEPEQSMLRNVIKLSTDSLKSGFEAKVEELHTDRESGEIVVVSFWCAEYAVGSVYPTHPTATYTQFFHRIDGEWRMMPSSHRPLSPQEQREQDAMLAICKSLDALQPRK